MDVVAALTMFVGFCMVGVAGVFALLGLGNLRLARVLRRTPPTPIGSWRAERGRVSAEAVTAHGEAGPQVGPLSGEACAWYEMTLVRISHAEHSSSPRLDAGRTPSWPALADASGRVTVDPRLLTDRWGEARHDHAPPATETTSSEYTHRRDAAPPPWLPPGLVRGLSHGETVLMREVRLPAGRPVFALGRPARGSLRPARRAFVTPGSRADLTAATRDDLRLTARTIPIMLGGGLAVLGGGYVLLLLVA